MFQVVGLSHERIYRRITQRVDRFSIRPHTLNNIQFFPLKSYRTNNVLALIYRIINVKKTCL